MFNKVKFHEKDIPTEKESITLKELIFWIRDNMIKDRPELFIVDGSLYVISIPLFPPTPPPPPTPFFLLHIRPIITSNLGTKIRLFKFIYLFIEMPPSFPSPPLHIVLYSFGFIALFSILYFVPLSRTLYCISLSLCILSLSRVHLISYSYFSPLLLSPLFFHSAGAQEYWH